MNDKRQLETDGIIKINVIIYVVSTKVRIHLYTK